MVPSATLRFALGDRTAATTFTIERRELLWELAPGEMPGLHDVSERVVAALRQPIGTPPLATLVRERGPRTVIVVDDLTRSTPQAVMLPPLLDELNEAGVPDGAITLLIALGTHRPMTTAECRARFGEAVLRRVPVVNHQPDAEHLVDLGETPSGVPISVSRLYHEAQVSIAVGSIVPHCWAGWGGGGKMIQPGVCGSPTTAATHLLAAPRWPEILGRPVNPVRAEIEQVALHSGLSFILNAVLNQEHAIVQVVAGHPVEAFRAAMPVAQSLYRRVPPAPADIVVADATPVDLDFWQAVKPATAGTLMTRPGGTLILVASCPEGVARSHPILLELGPLDPRTVQRMAEQGEIADIIGATSHIGIGIVRQRVQAILVSEGVTAEETAALGFIHAPSVEDALAMARKQQGVGARLGVAHHAGHLTPV